MKHAGAGPNCCRPCRSRSPPWNGSHATALKGVIRRSILQGADGQLRALLKASAHYDRFEDRGGIDKLGDGSLVQAAAAHKIAI